MFIQNERLAIKDTAGDSLFISIKIDGKEARIAKICLGGDVMVLTTAGIAFSVYTFNINAEAPILNKELFAPFAPIEDISCSGGLVVGDQVILILFNFFEYFLYFFLYFGFCRSRII